MSINPVLRATVLAAALCLLAMSSAHAQATRTWVSGVGDDANPCSRTAPCKTFAGAISKTAVNGEINALDPGGFGAVTVTKSITIDGGRGQIAGVLVSGTNGITINAGVNDVVNIRNVVIDGLGPTGLSFNGIKFLAGKELHLDNVRIQGFQRVSPDGNGVSFTPSGTSRLFVNNCVIQNNGVFTAGTASSGILIKPVLPSGRASVVVDNTVLEGNMNGLRAETGGVINIKHSSATGSFLNGIYAFSAAVPGAIIMLDDVISANNLSSGVRSEGANALVRLSDVSVFNNNTGLARPGGQIISYGNNRIADNTTNGTPSSTVAQQ